VIPPPPRGPQQLEIAIRVKPRPGASGRASARTGPGGASPRRVEVARMAARARPRRDDPLARALPVHRTRSSSRSSDSSVSPISSLTRSPLAYAISSIARSRRARGSSPAAPRAAPPPRPPQHVRQRPRAPRRPHGERRVLAREAATHQEFVERAQRGDAPRRGRRGDRALEERLHVPRPDVGRRAIRLRRGTRRRPPGRGVARTVFSESRRSSRGDRGSGRGAGPAPWGRKSPPRARSPSHDPTGGGAERHLELAALQPSR